eukprot:2741768-Amphidinium_carterae.2
MSGTVLGVKESGLSKILPQPSPYAVFKTSAPCLSLAPRLIAAMLCRRGDIRVVAMLWCLGRHSKQWSTTVTGQAV